MEILFALLGFGFLLGLKHAFDADHIAAITALNSSNPSIKGLFWGIGHTISLLVVGVVVLLFKITIPEKLALSFEFIVGIMLVILGLNALISAKRYKLHFHKHRHGEKEHLHLHSHYVSKNHIHGHKSLLVGLVHGLAGSAALTLLVLSTIKSVYIGIVYILVFGIGSIIGMTIISKVVSLPFKFMEQKLHRANNMLRLGSGAASLLIGIIIIHSTIALF